MILTGSYGMEGHICGPAFFFLGGGRGLCIFPTIFGKIDNKEESKVEFPCMLGN